MSMTNDLVDLSHPLLHTSWPSVPSSLHGHFVTPIPSTLVHFPDPNHLLIVCTWFEFVTMLKRLCFLLPVAKHCVIAVRFMPEISDFPELVDWGKYTKWNWGNGHIRNTRPHYPWSNTRPHHVKVKAKFAGILSRDRCRWLHTIYTPLRQPCASLLPPGNTCLLIFDPLMFNYVSGVVFGLIILLKFACWLYY